MFAHLNKSNDFPTALQTLRLPARGRTPLPPSPPVNPSCLSARPSFPPLSDSTAQTLWSSWTVQEGLRHSHLYTPLPCHLPFAPRVSAKLSSLVSGTTRSFFHRCSHTHTHPQKWRKGRGCWFRRANWGKGKGTCWESRGRGWRWPGTPGRSRGLKAPSCAGAKGRRAPAPWELAEASSRLQSCLPEGCEACAWGQQTPLF